MKLTGTIINYYYHCKRQCWLHAHKINLEDNSEDVKVGRVLHELKNENKEVALEGIKIDKISGDYVIEFKKSDADLEAAKQQLIYYLYTLKKHGIDKKGKLEVLEKNKHSRSTHLVELAESDIMPLEQRYAEILLFLNNEYPPTLPLTHKCKKCAYYEYCFI